MPGMWQDDGFKQGICLKLTLFLETVQKLFCECLACLDRHSFSGGSYAQMEERLQHVEVNGRPS